MKASEIAPRITIAVAPPPGRNATSTATAAMIAMLRNVCTP
jgi:hypothetical protein